MSLHRRRRKSRRLIWVTLAVSTAAAIAAALSLHAFVAEPFAVASASMRPALRPGDIVIVNKRAYAGGEAPAPARGDVVAFRNPKDGRVVIKRIIGLPGEIVRLEDGVVHIGDAPATRTLVGRYTGQDLAGAPIDILAYDEHYAGHGRIRVHHWRYPDGSEAGLDAAPPVTTPAERYYVLGDNRDGSVDSRRPDRVGLVAADAVIGRVDWVAVSVTPQFRWWNPARWSAVRAGRRGLRVQHLE